MAKTQAATKGRKLNELDPGPAKGKAKKANGPETISVAVNARTGNGLVITTNKNRTIVVQRVDGTVNKLALIGLPIKPLEEYLASRPAPQGKLAHGVDSHNSPHSAKAVADNRAAATKAGKAAKAAATPKPAKAAKAARKAERAARTDPGTKVTMLVKPADAGVTLGRLAKLQLMAKCKTLGAFLGQSVTDSAGKVHTCKMDAVAGMLRRNHIKLG